MSPVTLSPLNPIKPLLLNRMVRWLNASRLVIFITFHAQLITASPVQAKETYAIVASPTLSLSSPTPRTFLNLFLLRQTSDEAGQLVTIVSLDPNSEAFERFISQCLHWNPHIISQRWHRNLYTGEGRTSLLVNHWQAMQQTLLTTPHALGYLPVHLAQRSGLKILIKCDPKP